MNLFERKTDNLNKVVKEADGILADALKTEDTYEPVLTEDLSKHENVNESTKDLKIVNTQK